MINPKEKCPHCDKEYLKKALSRHINKNHPHIEISCKFCTTDIKQIEAYAIYYCSQVCFSKDLHTNFKLIPSDDKFSFINFEDNKKNILNGECPHCDKSYAKLSKLKAHIFKEHTEKTGLCFNTSCNKEHDGSFGIGAYCSKTCSNKKIISEETKQKISLKLISNNREEVISYEDALNYIKEKLTKKYNGLYIYDKLTTINRSKDILIKCKKHNYVKIKLKSHISGKHCPECFKEENSKNKSRLRNLTVSKNKYMLFENLSENRIKTFIRKEQNNRCNKCNEFSWNNKKIPLDLEHIDGDHYNNKRENVECLCPNCHSLTPTWRGRNKSNNTNKKVLFKRENVLPIYKSNLSLEKTIHHLGLPENKLNIGILKTRLKALNILYIENDKLSTNIKNLSCPHCEKTYRETGSLFMHIKKNHQDLEGNNKFICKSCKGNHDGLYGIGECCSLSCTAKYGHIKSKRKKVSQIKYSQKEMKDFVLKSIEDFYRNRKARILSLSFSELKFKTLRERIFYEQDGKCNHCNRVEWQGKPITLELEHRDGNHHNDVRKNVEMICPNCHNLTPTHSGRGKDTRFQVSDEELVKAYETEGNIRKALISVGMAAKGGNYSRVKKVLTEAGVSYELNGKVVSLEIVSCKVII